MTKFRNKSFIPQTDIKIKPETFLKKIINFIDSYIDDTFEEKNKKFLSIFLKEFKNFLKNYQLWYESATYNFCCYIYTDRIDKNINRICGRRIDKKNEQNNINMFFCSEHDREHRKKYSKPIQLKDGEIYCKHIKKDGNHCKYASKLDGLCVKHYKYVYNIEIKEIYDKIKKINYKTKIEIYTDKCKDENIDKIYLDIDKFVLKTELKKIKIIDNIYINSNPIKLYSYNKNETVRINYDINDTQNIKSKNSFLSFYDFDINKKVCQYKYILNVKITNGGYNFEDSKNNFKSMINRIHQLNDNNEIINNLIDINKNKNNDLYTKDNIKDIIGIQLPLFFFFLKNKCFLQEYIFNYVFSKNKIKIKIIKY